MNKAKVKATCIKHYLPLALCFAVAVGLIIPDIGRNLAKPEIGDYGVVQTICVFYIFLCQGMTLKTDDIKKALSAYVPFSYGLVAILLITPWLGYGMFALAYAIGGGKPEGSGINDSDIFPYDFYIGFVLFACMPTTLNSGVALAAAAGGNFAIALLITVGSNVLGIFTIPLMLKAMLAADNIEIDPLPMLAKLAVSIIIPCAIGKFLRRFKVVTDTLAKYKVPIGLSTHTALVIIPNLKISGSRDDITSQSGVSLLVCVLFGLLLHSVFLVFNYTVACAARWPLDIRKSVVIMTSEKTLPVAMTVLAFFPTSVGDPGFIAIPCIISHFSQLMMDSVLASHWADVKETLKEEKPAEPAKGEEEAKPEAAPAPQTVGSEEAKGGGQV
mmetsp:Transcript_27171/g.65383  ORF Transcript_27171/g.65383 Transcript_27171/m.65383 type:complete len:386 (+) Transcript_27171:46-1203(+)